MDRKFTVTNLLEKAWEYNVEIRTSYITSSLTPSAYDRVRRDKLYETIKLFGIQNKLIRLIKVTMNDSTYRGKIGLMTDGFKVENGLKQRDGLASNLFNTVLEYVIRQLSVESNPLYFTYQCN